MLINSMNSYRFTKYNSRSETKVSGPMKHHCLKERRVTCTMNQQAVSTLSPNEKYLLCAMLAATLCRRVVDCKLQIG